MRLKTFYGPTLSDAMHAVREALGDNAIIVASRDDEPGGVRVTAAIDDADAESNVISLGGSEAIETIADALVDHQTPSVLAERLLAAATQHADDDPVKSLSAAFDALLLFQPLNDEKSRRPLVFVGPPGGGKTLSAAKFATQAALAKKPVTVISTDTERAGGREQLAAFTRLLKLPLMEVEDAQTLRDTVKLQPPETLVVIDTAGLNPFQNSTRKHLQPLIAAAGGNAVLVLPASMDSSEAIDMAAEFRDFGVSSLLVTGLDMTRRLGGLLRAAFESRLPLAHFSASCKVTEAPMALSAEGLARMVLAARD